MFRSRIEVFCAFCRSQRRIYSQRRIGFPHILGASLASILVMLAIWRDFDARVMVIFVIFLAVAEVLVQTRWRMSLSCQHCGFDPVAYKKNPTMAAEKVKLHLDQRKNNPRFLLARKLDLPTRKIEATQSSRQSSTGPSPGRLVSRQI